MLLVKEFEKNTLKYATSKVYLLDNIPSVLFLVNM